MGFDSAAAVAALEQLFTPMRISPSAASPVPALARPLSPIQPLPAAYEASWHGAAAPVQSSLQHQVITMSTTDGGAPAAPAEPLGRSTPVAAGEPPSAPVAARRQQVVTTPGGRVTAVGPTPASEQPSLARSPLAGAGAAGVRPVPEVTAGAPHLPRLPRSQLLQGFDARELHDNQPAHCTARVFIAHKQNSRQSWRHILGPSAGEYGGCPDIASAKADAGAAAAGDAGGSLSDAMPRAGESTEVCRVQHHLHHHQAASPTVNVSLQQQQQQAVLPPAAAPGSANQPMLLLSPARAHQEGGSSPSAAALPPAPPLLLSQPPTPADAEQMGSPDNSTQSSPWLTYVASAAKVAAGATAPAGPVSLQGGQLAAEAESLTPPAQLVPQFAAAQVMAGTWSACPSQRSSLLLSEACFNDQWPFQSPEGSAPTRVRDAFPNFACRLPFPWVPGVPSVQTTNISSSHSCRKFPPAP